MKGKTMNDARLTTAVLDRMIELRLKELADKLLDTLPEVAEMDRRTLPPGYINNAIADIRALGNMRTMAAHRERTEQEAA